MSDVAALAESLHPHEAKVLTALDVPGSPLVQNEETLAKSSGLEVAQVGAALGRLQIKGLVSILSEVTRQIVSLTDTGERYFQHYAPMVRIISALRAAADTGAQLTIKDIQQREELDAAELSGAVGELKQEGVIRIATGGIVDLAGASSSTAESLQKLIQYVHEGAKPLTEFAHAEQTLIAKFAQKRGKPNEPFRVDDRVSRVYGVTETGQAVLQQIRREGVREEVARLTPEMLKDGSWRSARFRKYTIGLSPARIPAGKKHPYREFLDLVKTKLTAMGFEEMRGGLVENEFWNMDTLFMPQFHPARETHDVYFVKDPTHSAPVREPFLAQVAQAHENGGKTGSSGWNYTFDRMRTRRLVLRSQGTAVSARTLAAAPKVPGKYFSIARCFRYDQVDATHAPDFFQVEGIVLGPDINFRTLLGLLTLFAREVAQAQEIRFTPAYFPFTEPSVELHVRHPRLGWIELGGAGLFRPEVTRPLGIDVPVIAWGLGLDRMAMVALEIHDIRDLFSGDLEMIRSKRVQY
ncbi:MAG: phenylalanine--tRNA ligase subunit alpha [Nitrospirae bacterium]|nr:phenylalanine--tRNA ligase subunit alpha [Nitrospirota bacterium]